MLAYTLVLIETVMFGVFALLAYQDGDTVSAGGLLVLSLIIATMPRWIGWWLDITARKPAPPVDAPPALAPPATPALPAPRDSRFTYLSPQHYANLQAEIDAKIASDDFEIHKDGLFQAGVFGRNIRMQR